MIIVSGRTTTGTSMLMHMLHVGGIPAIYDSDKNYLISDIATKERHPFGYYESKKMGNPIDLLGTRMEERACVKLFEESLVSLLEAGLLPDKVLLTSRPFKDSTNWRDRKKYKDPEHYKKFVDKAKGVHRQAVDLLRVNNVPTLEVQYHDMVDKPEAMAQTIAKFVGGNLDVAAMAGVPNPKLRHHGGKKAKIRTVLDQTDKVDHPNKSIIWLTGQSGAGKSTLAEALNQKLGGVVLDGDEMRKSISVGLGFSKKDREDHNLRVARLAKTLCGRVPVIVSVIAPFRSTRRKIDSVAKPVWVYMQRPSVPILEARPYEVPVTSHVVVNSDAQTTVEQVDIILEYLMNL